jgi:hypothetical protein
MAPVALEAFTDIVDVFEVKTGRKDVDLRGDGAPDVMNLRKRDSAGIGG